MQLPKDKQKRIKEAERKARAVLKEVAKAKRQLVHSGNTYSTHREKMAARSAELSESGRDIGELPKVVDEQRKKNAEKNFRLFCESYFPNTFELEWSEDHLKVIQAIEESVLRGGLFAFAMPRGSGKTSLVEAAALWSILYGHHEFIAIIGADEAHARTMLDSIKTECEVSEIILEDFPEAVYPIVALEKIHQRSGGQLYKGKPTSMSWTAQEVQFPTVEGSKASGGIIRVAGITGRIRGMSAKRACDSRKVRPSLVLIDDPQTDESAGSPSQVMTREAVLKGAILGLSGPGTKIAGLCTVTVVKPDDLADRLLDRSQHPAWQGQRTRLIYDWPTNEDLWSEYAELRKEGQRSGAGTKPADDFYKKNKKEMDNGSRVAWKQRKNPDELSAIQHAWNLRIDRGETAFASEFQNDPLIEQNDVGRLQKKHLMGRGNKVKRNTVPTECDALTAFIDVQEKCLFWLVTAWNKSFGGSVISYGVYPEQPSRFFDASNVKKTLSLVADGAGFEASLAAGLETVVNTIMSKDWQREDGLELRVSQLMIDANWGQSTAVVRTFCKRSPFSGSILPSHGRGITASGNPINDRNKKRGDKIGLNWRIGQMSPGQRSTLYDTNFWKSFVAARLKHPLGDPEALCFYEGEHELLAEHLCAEFPVRTEAKGRVVDEWKATPNRDNHWFDCLVGSAVAASITGVLPSSVEAGGRHRRKVSMPTLDGRPQKIKVKRLKR